MSTIVLDIETRPDPSMDSAEFWQWWASRQEPDGRIKDPLKQQAALDEKQAKAKSRMALHAPTAVVVVIGIQKLEDDEPLILAGEPTRDGEARLLKAFGEWLMDNTDTETLWTGWHIKRFDLPVLAGRSMIHRVRLASLPRVRDYRRVFDLADDLSLPGSLTEWQYAMGGGFKEVEGEALLHISIPELAEHCRQDMKWTAEMVHRTAPIWSRR